MIDSVELVNFKNFRQQKIELDRLTVFVGPNGSGKTSVLEAIYLAATVAVPRMVVGGLATVPEERLLGRNHCDWLYFRAGTGDLKISCMTSGGTFSIRGTPPAGYPPRQSELFGEGNWTLAIEPRDIAALNAALAPARSLVFLRLDAGELARPAYSELTPPRIERSGRGLPSVLAYMALSDRDNFDLLVDEMRSLVPHLKRIRFTKSAVIRREKELVRFGNESVERTIERPYQGDDLIFDFDNANNIPAFFVSEGPLMLLGLLTILMGPGNPDILLMDDIEHGLHPNAQKSLIGTLGKLAKRDPKLQILATAHSPYLLDCLKPEQIRITTLAQDGTSICGRLIDHPQFAKWKDEMAPGEMWSLFGEKWLAGAKP